jgi:hypothetical protein
MDGQTNIRHFQFILGKWYQRCEHLIYYGRRFLQNLMPADGSGNLAGWPTGVTL